MRKKLAEENGTNEAVTAISEITEISGAKDKDVNAGKEKTVKKYIYLGASLPDHSLKENTVFDGTLEEIKLFLQGEITKYPLIKELLVPVERLAETGKGRRISGLKKELIKSFERGH